MGKISKPYLQFNPSIDIYNSAEILIWGRDLNVFTAMKKCDYEANRCLICHRMNWRSELPDCCLKDRREVGLAAL